MCVYRRSVTKMETNILGVCGKELSLAGFDDLAKEAYKKMDDFANVLALHVKNQVSPPPQTSAANKLEPQQLGIPPRYPGVVIQFFKSACSPTKTPSPSAHHLFVGISRNGQLLV